MNIQNLKVSQVAELLQQDDLPLHIMEALRSDGRSSVRNLIDKWINRQRRRQQDQHRLKELYSYESAFYEEGYQLIAGIDEAGRGPLAGPVVVAAVILPAFANLPGINDSKQLSAAQRENLYANIHSCAQAISWQAIPVELIDEINIYQATVFGMYRVAETLHPDAQVVLIDAVKLPKLTVPWQAIIGGDALSASIAAASVIAKVERDRIMLELHEQYPDYGFNRHKGYATKEHLAALHKLGPCPAHRRSFEPVKSGGGLFGTETDHGWFAAT